MIPLPEIEDTRWTLNVGSMPLFLALKKPRMARGFPITAQLSLIHAEFQPVFPSGAKARLYLVAFAAPFGSAQGRLLKSCPFKSSTYLAVHKPLFALTAGWP
jgi:hypothetical protein